MFGEDGRLTRLSFLENWRQIEKESYVDIDPSSLISLEPAVVLAMLESKRIFHVATRKIMREGRAGVSGALALFLFCPMYPPRFCLC